MPRKNFSLVEYYSERDKGPCPNCTSPSTGIKRGIWAYSISDLECQHLIDRGLERHSVYFSKSIMSETCCPGYTIRCDVGEAKLTKSQKKVLKKFHNRLRYGNVPKNLSQPATPSEKSLKEDDKEKPAEVMPSQMEAVGSLSTSVEKSEKKEKTPSQEEDKEEPAQCVPSQMEAGGSLSTSVEISEKKERLPPDKGKANPDVSVTLPQPKKAKLIRLENKYKQLLKRGISEGEAKRLTYKSKKPLQERSFEDYFPSAEEASHFIHNFKTKLVPVSALKDDEALLEETHKLYEKYQMTVHHDPPEKWTLDNFVSFLVQSPIYDSHPGEGPSCGFGTFHLQYWLDDRLIAVGVIDILPKCVSSIYFFYDPELRFLSLGTYGCLREIFYTRSLMAVYPPIKYYSLGYYIHGCPQMAYKVNYHPSYLLCPETFTWHPVEKCLPMLDQSKYSRFETDLGVKNQLLCDVDLAKVTVCGDFLPTDYLMYKLKNSSANDEEEVTEYARLVGEECYQTIYLIRKSF